MNASIRYNSILHTFGYTFLGKENIHHGSAAEVFWDWINH